MQEQQEDGISEIDISKLAELRDDDKNDEEQ